MDRQTIESSQEAPTQEGKERNSSTTPATVQDDVLMEDKTRTGHNETETKATSIDDVVDCKRTETRIQNPATGTGDDDISSDDENDEFGLGGYYTLSSRPCAPQRSTRSISGEGESHVGRSSTPIHRERTAGTAAQSNAAHGPQTDDSIPRTVPCMRDTFAYLDRKRAEHEAQEAPKGNGRDYRGYRER